MEKTDRDKQTFISKLLRPSSHLPLLLSVHKVTPVRPSTIPSSSNGPFKHNLHKNVIQKVLKCSVVNN